MLVARDTSPGIGEPTRWPDEDVDLRKEEEEFISQRTCRYGRDYGIAVRLGFFSDQENGNMAWGQVSSLFDVVYSTSVYMYGYGSRHRQDRNLNSQNDQCMQL